MANDIDTSVRTAVEKIATYVDNIATMSVETKYVRVDDPKDVDFTQSKPVARTIVKLDGDSESVIPVRVSEKGDIEVDTDLFKLHQQNVSIAMDYRARLLDALIGMLKSVTQ